LQTINIVHPNDPRGDGKPLTITTRKLTQVSRMKLEEEQLKMRQPHEIERADPTGGTNRVVIWDAPVPGIESNLFWLRQLENIAAGWINPPTEDEDGNPVSLTFGHEGLMYLFDPKFDIPSGYVIPKPDGTTHTTTGPVSFPFYIVVEHGKPERWANPTSGGSQTTST
jgi:hypothetical protein